VAYGAVASALHKIMETIRSGTQTLLEPGCLILVVGPSGAGKDSLLDAARRHFNANPAILFPRRIITRAKGAGGEEHIPVTPAVFRNLAAEGAFALHWHAHGLSYGLPMTINPALKNGRHIVANVSRTVLDDARARFRHVAVLSVVADPAVLADRLRGRGRETGDDLAARLARASFQARGG